jgi:hypothetical protein
MTNDKCEKDIYISEQMKNHKFLIVQDYAIMYEPFNIIFYIDSNCDEQRLNADKQFIENLAKELNIECNISIKPPLKLDDLVLRPKKNCCLICAVINLYIFCWPCILYLGCNK